MNLKKLTTENRNPSTFNLDEMSSLEIVTTMNQEDYRVPKGIETELKSISELVDAVVNAIENGGRLIYMGAGTSGRLGVLDASECPPTYGVDPSLVVGLIAGGDKALRLPLENVEDKQELGVEDLKNINLTSKDVVVGLAASGRTPYVIGGLNYANSLGCVTGSIACNKNSKIGEIAKIKIEVDAGPEILTGSTRLKSGTAQKMVLNMISTASMVRLGKAYSNLMVDVVPTNEKLMFRATGIIVDATGVDEEKAKEMLQEANGNCKLAITAILTGKSVDEAKLLLEKAKGHVKKALELSK